MSRTELLYSNRVRRRSDVRGDLGLEQSSATAPPEPGPPAVPPVPDTTVPPPDIPPPVPSVAPVPLVFGGLVEPPGASTVAVQATKPSVQASAARCGAREWHGW